MKCTDASGDLPLDVETTAPYSEKDGRLFTADIGSTPLGVPQKTVFQIIVWVRVTGHDRSRWAARSLLFHTFPVNESRSRSDNEKMDKKEKSDDYDSPSDLWSVF